MLSVGSEDDGSVDASRLSWPSGSHRPGCSGACCHLILLDEGVSSAIAMLVGFDFLVSLSMLLDETLGALLLRRASLLRFNAGSSDADDLSVDVGTDRTELFSSGSYVLT